jgi:uncharacterized membrane protein
MFIFGIASVAAGVLDLIWREFESAHQPIQAWGDHIPRITILAYVAALWLIAAGATMSVRRTAQAGAAALAILYAIFAVFPVPRLYTAPHFFGHRAAVYIGVIVQIGQQLILFVAAAVASASLSRRGSVSVAPARLARWVFGLCCIDFGLAHLTGVQAVAQMIPKWMPLGGPFWTILTGIAFVLAGLSIIVGIQDVLAARLLGLMLLVFSVAVLTPRIFAHPHLHTAWGADAYNLTAVGAAWILADWLATRPRCLPTEQTTARAAPSIA